jgi:hypothetical protein
MYTPMGMSRVIARKNRRRRSTVAVVKLDANELCLLKLLAKHFQQPRTTVVRHCIVEIARQIFEGGLA